MPSVMIELVYSPKWFFGKDIAIDVVSLIVLVLIGLFALKYYSINKKKKSYFYLALSFFVLGIAFLCKIMTNFTIYYIDTQIRQVGFLVFTVHTLKSTDVLFFLGLLLYRVLTLIGLYILYLIYFHNKQPRSTTFIIFLLLVLLTYFTLDACFVFHLVSFLLLIFITRQYFINYKKNKRGTTKLLAYSFALIALSQLLFLFLKMSYVTYVAGEILQLVGYCILLFTFIMVLNHGKKKKQN